MIIREGPEIKDEIQTLLSFAAIQMHIWTLLLIVHY